jgi:hypothetical protein
VALRSKTIRSESLAGTHRQRRFRGELYIVSSCGQHENATRLGLRLCGRALDRRIGLGDAQHHRLRQLDADHATVEDDRAQPGEPLGEVAGDVAELLGGERELLVGVRLHEVVAVAVGVEELDGTQPSSGSSIASAERKVLSKTFPVRRLRIFAFTSVLAPRADGLWKWTSRTVNGSPSISMRRPRFRSLAESMALFLASARRNTIQKAGIRLFLVPRPSWIRRDHLASEGARALAADVRSVVF